MVDIKPLHILVVLIAISVILVAIIFTWPKPVSAQITADSLLYPVDTSIDDAKLALELDAAKKSMLANNILDKRLSNIESSLQNKNPSDANKVTDDYLKTLQDLQKAVDDMNSRKNSNDILALDSLLRKISDYEKRIAVLEYDLQQQNQKNSQSQPQTTQQTVQSNPQTTAQPAPPANTNTSTVVNQNTIQVIVQNNVTSDNSTSLLLQKLEQSRLENEAIKIKAEQARKYNIELMKKEVADVKNDIFAIKQTITCLNGLANNADEKVTNIDSMIANGDYDGATSEMALVKALKLGKGSC